MRINIDKEIKRINMNVSKEILQEICGTCFYFDKGKENPCAGICMHKASTTERVTYQEHCPLWIEI